MTGANANANANANAKYHLRVFLAGVLFLYVTAITSLIAMIWTVYAAIWEDDDDRANRLANTAILLFFVAFAFGVAALIASGLTADVMKERERRATQEKDRPDD
jgi:SNF family Na+-dependent transporter